MTSEPVSTLAERGRYSAAAVLSCAAFLITPEPYTIRVREKAKQDPTQTWREVAVTCFLPELPFGPPSVDARGTAAQDDRPVPERSDDDWVDVFPFPYLTPMKGDLRSIHDVKVDGERRAMHLSHAEHKSIVCLMISELLYVVGSIWLHLDFEYARRHLKAIEGKLHRIPSETPEQASQTLLECFDDGGRLRAWRLSVRHDRESQLFRLCSAMVERNVVVVEVAAEPETPFEVRYTEVTSRSPKSDSNDMSAHASARERIVRFLGAQPSNVRFEVPWASQTTDYHFYATAPEGYYFQSQIAYDSEDLRDGKATPLPRLVHRRDGCARYQRNRGAVGEAHIHIVDAANTGRPLHIGLSVNEIPLGSAWPAFLAAVSTFAVMSLLMVAKFLSGGSLGSATVPALLVALVSNSISLSSTLFAHNGSPQSGSAFGRLGLLLCALLGNVFAVWWLFNQGAPRLGSHTAEWIKVYLGWLLALGAGTLSAVTMLRLRRVVRIFQRTERRM